jgi:c-di-GMP-binding flagellar brake protein YcgR
MPEEKRRHKRLNIHLPVQLRVDEDEPHNLEVVDISSSGMRIKSQDFDILKSGFDAVKNRGIFSLSLMARLAWAQSCANDQFVTGWEFAIKRSDTQRGLEGSLAGKGKRRHARLPIDLSVRAQVVQGAVHKIELVDISPSGMQLRLENLDAVKEGMDTRTNLAMFRLQIAARLAWVQTHEQKAYLTGWEFEVESPSDP